MNPKVEWIIKRPRYQKILMLVGVQVLIAGLFAWLLFLPKQEEYQQKLKTIANQQVKLEADRRVARNLAVFQAEYDKMQARLEEAKKELPASSEIPRLLTSISSRAKGSGLEVLSFRPGSEVPKEFYAEVPVALKLEGSFHQYASFLYAVSTLDRIVNISDLKIGTKKTQGSATNVLSIDCIATTFRFIEKPAAATAGAAGAGGKK